MSLPVLKAPYRLVQPDDFPEVRDFILDSSKSRHDEFEQMNHEAMKQWFEKWLQRINDKSGVFYILKETGIIQSWISVLPSPYARDTLNLSFRFLKAHVDMTARRKLITDITHSVLREVEWHRVESVCSGDDQESRNLLVLCGFRLEGTMRQALHLRSGWIDLNIYGILKSDLSREIRT